MHSTPRFVELLVAPIECGLPNNTSNDRRGVLHFDVSPSLV